MLDVGDIVTIVNGDKFLVYDVSDDLKILFVTDFQKNELNLCISYNDVVDVEKKPSNVEVLFLRKRDRNLKGLEKYR